MHRADFNWASVHSCRQQDWVDTVVTVEQWLEQHVGVKGEDWEWYSHTGCGQLGFKRDCDCMWFKLAFC
jgi:hypothetical protein